MTEILLTLCGLLSAVTLGFMYYSSKNHTVDQICNHPELSDEKVRLITKMMRRQYKNDNN